MSKCPYSLKSVWWEEGGWRLKAGELPDLMGLKYSRGGAPLEALSCRAESWPGERERSEGPGERERSEASCPGEREGPMNPTGAAAAPVAPR